ncbi:MAG: MerR family transcriptional regulator [Chloroflexi bacterium]|nr:MerR family transcriptional regulator [Chloroflexota bacterium]
MVSERFAGYSATPVYNIKALAQATGIPAATVRAWERRYAAVAAARTPTGRRLYSDRDIAVLRWLHDRQQEGLSIARAVDLLRQPAPEPAAPPDPPLPAGTPAQVQARLLDAVGALDGPAAERILTETLAVYPLSAVLEAIVTPALAQAGDLRMRGVFSIAGELLLSTVAAAQVGRFLAAAPAPLPGPPVLVGAAPGELHDFGALLLALHLRWRRIPVLYLGARLPYTGIEADLRGLRPAAVCMSAALPESAAHVTEMANMIAALPPPRPLFVCYGAAFLHTPTLRDAVGDAYLGDSASAAADRLGALLRRDVAGGASR